MTDGGWLTTMIGDYRRLTGAGSLLLRGAPDVFDGDVLLALAEAPGLRWVIDPLYPAGRITVEEERRRRAR